MNMKIRAHSGLLYLLKLMKLFILIVLAYNIFLKNIEFINCMFKGKTLLDYTNLFSPNDFKKNDRVIKRIFKNE